MSKAENVDDLLGGDAAPAAAFLAAAKKEASKAPAKPAKEPKPKAGDPAPKAKPAAAKKAPAKKEAPAAEKAARVRTPMTFEEGERDKLYAKITKALSKVDKKGINSRELAEKLGTETRKLRVCLYTMQGQGTVKLKSGDSKVAGMTVIPA